MVTFCDYLFILNLRPLPDCGTVIPLTHVLPSKVCLFGFRNPVQAGSP